MKVVIVAAVAMAGAAVAAAPVAGADNKRLNDSVAANVYTTQGKAGCDTEIKVNPKLRLAAQWHAVDLLHNRALNGDLGTDGSTVQDRANAAGFQGRATQTVAINPAMSITGVEIMQQWYGNPQALATMSDCANSAIGVWSENSLDRTVVVAVYGEPA